MTDEPLPVPPAPPPPPEDKPKPRRRWVKRLLLIALCVFVLVPGVFELWRQGTMKAERDALAVTMQHVDDTILRGRTPVQYYNAGAAGNNGWKAYRGALSFMPSTPGREPDPLLREMVDYQNEGAEFDRPSTPDIATMRQWLAASQGIANALNDAALTDVLAREYGPGDSWRQASIDVMAEVDLWKVACLRVELLIDLKQQATAEEELVALVRLSGLRSRPGNIIEGLVTLSRSTLATDLAVRVAERGRLSSKTLQALAAAWPKGVPLFAPMLEGELVWMCWLVQSDPLISSADGWFSWFPRQEAAEFEERGAFVGISLRRAVRANMQHLQKCLESSLQGESLAGLPAPGEMANPLAIDVRPHGKRIVEADVLLRLRKAAIELRLLELDAPLAKQREKVEEFARRLHGIRVSFEGDDCVLTVAAEAFPGVEFEPKVATIRLKPLP